MTESFYEARDVSGHIRVAYIAFVVATLQVKIFLYITKSDISISCGSNTFVE